MKYFLNHCSTAHLLNLSLDRSKHIQVRWNPVCSLVAYPTHCLLEFNMNHVILSLYCFLLVTKWWVGLNPEFCSSPRFTFVNTSRSRQCFSWPWERGYLPCAPCMNRLWYCLPLGEESQRPRDHAYLQPSLSPPRPQPRNSQWPWACF